VACVRPVPASRATDVPQEGLFAARRLGPITLSQVRHFLALSDAEFKTEEIRVSEEMTEHLLLRRWPGNLRQLQNEVRRLAARALGISREGLCLKRRRFGL
jgi:transcriptional regulator with AAA-type ATPase domain